VDCAGLGGSSDTGKSARSEFTGYFGFLRQHCLDVSMSVHDRARHDGDRFCRLIWQLGYGYVSYYIKGFATDG
jgi:hypothetical protein